MDLPSLEHTRAFARCVIEALPHGALLLLVGPLGAGKTTLTGLLSRELGSDARVSSPTYTLIHEYPGPHGVLVHIDAYRLPNAKTLFELGLEDYLERARLIVVEWGEELAESFPDAFVARLELNERGRRGTLFQGEQLIIS